MTISSLTSSLSLAEQTLHQQLHQQLRELTKEFSRVSFANSLGAEDMVLTDLIARHKLPIDIFSLDTGRLPDETYQLLDAINQRYSGLHIRVLFPQNELVQALVSEHGINGFYKSIDARKACCQARKVVPLKRALSQSQAWITGLRREQSEARAELKGRDQDSLTGLPKINPLLDWTADQVQSYLQHYAVPVNALHARGYPSIGCAPCTRAIQPGEHPRAGRWWWEAALQAKNGQAAQECGLHVDPNGKLIRTIKNIGEALA